MQFCSFFSLVQNFFIRLQTPSINNSLLFDLGFILRAPWRCVFRISSSGAAAMPRSGWRPRRSTLPGSFPLWVSPGVPRFGGHLPTPGGALANLVLP